MDSNFQKLIVPLDLYTDEVFIDTLNKLEPVYNRKQGTTSRPFCLKVDLTQYFDSIKLQNKEPKNYRFEIKKPIRN